MATSAKIDGTIVPADLSQTQKVEAQLASQPVSADVLFLRGIILEQMGRRLDARNIYLELLVLEPSHIGALNNLGKLLFAAEKEIEARKFYAEAVVGNPDDPIRRANLASLLTQQKELQAARERVLASWLQPTGFNGPGAIPPIRRGVRPPIKVLELISARGGNSPLDSLLSHPGFETCRVVTDSCHSGIALPPHQLVVNAIADTDLAAEALAGAQSLVAHAAAPVINPPAAVMQTGRCDIARRLSSVPGVITPKTMTLSRELLVAPDSQETLTRYGFDFPLLLRTAGFHQGEHFLRVETCAELPATLAKLPGRDLTAIEYLAGRAPDGKTRKYRVMMIHGRLYPLHAAISSKWKIHYFSAEMADYPAHRAEDAAFLEDMASVLGTPAMAALAEIQKTLGLDYAGIDFSLNEEGDLLLFEANATMVVPPPHADKRWDYRRPAVEKIYRAVWKMLMDRAKASG